MTRSRGRLLIYAPVPLYRKGDDLWLEDQAANGQRLWADNFEHITTMMPLQDGPPPASWAPVSEIGENVNRIRFVPLPRTYHPGRFLRLLPSVARQIRAEIEQADYLCLAIGGLIGDWGSVACLQARKMGRPYTVWTDRVESEVVRRTAREGSGKQRLKAALTHRPMAMYEKHVIRHATAGLFHGKETYDAYAPYCAKSFVVHDIHVKKADHIQPDALQAKISDAAQGPLKIGYVGRADPMKGALDWVSALEKLAARGVAFEAFWMGEGSQFEQMRARLDAAGLSKQVALLGFVRDRDEVLRRLRDTHLFMFCHKTPESPRCLIEALISGAPIVGYDGAFARDLIAAHQGGALVPLHDVDALVSAVQDLDGDRARLAALITAAAQDGVPHDDESVFHHRSEIIKSVMGPEA